MCGIAGIINKGSSDYEHHSVARMLARQQHRGPEGHAILQSGDAVFGQCQLAFVDIGISHQPYRWANGRRVLVFNGEIYNYREIRTRLQARGALRAELGEPALLAALYSELGADMAAELNGMFAIAIHDSDKGETLLMRDRFGKKPLFYFTRGSRLSFASELRALRADSLAPSAISPGSLARFLALNAVPAPDSLVEGVRKVPAGSWVVIKDGNVRGESYWNLTLSPRPQSEGEAVSEVGQKLNDAVKRRIPNEVPVGVFLSGGLDSALIAALAAPHVSKSLPTFSIGFPDSPSYDETQHAVETARAIGTNHTVVRLSRSTLAEQIPGLLAGIDEPIADPSFIPTAILARVARRTVKTVLTGDGADELAMGYRLFPAVAAMRLLLTLLPRGVIGGTLRFLGGQRASHKNLHYAHVSRLLERTLACPPEQIYNTAAAAVPASDWPSILEQPWYERTVGLDLFRELDHLLARHGPLAALERVQLGMMCYFLREVILTKLDRATMLASLEARSPFLDADLVETMLRLPLSLKMRPLVTKYALRRVARTLLPARFVGRPKRGFRIPLAQLLSGELREYATDMLSSDALRRTGFFRRDRVRELLDEQFSGRIDHHRTLWSLLCVQSWAFAEL